MATNGAAGWRSRIVGHGEADPTTLTANPRNWRTHPRPQLDALAGVLSEVGWVQDVIVNRTTGHVVDGHARIDLALSRKEPRVPVVYVELGPAEEAKVLATLDPVGAMAGADPERLAALVREVTTDDAALRGVVQALADEHGIDLGGGEDVPEVPEPELDRAEELRAKWGTAPGQLWVIGRHRLLCGDSTEAEDVGRLMGEERAGLMATDPPYQVEYHGGNHPRSLTNSELVKDKHHADYQEQADPEFFVRFLRLALERALTERPAVYQWHAYKRQAMVEQAWKDAGLLVHQQIIWVKARAVLTHSHFMWQHEPCFYGWPEGRQPERRPPNNATTVWQLDQQGLHGTHPTEKPIGIMARPIEYHLDPGELCYDPFSGSGTSMVAAEQAGRRCSAMEIAPAFVAVTLERLSQMGLEPRLEP